MSQQTTLPPIQQLDGQLHPQPMQTHQQYAPASTNGASTQHHPPPPLSNPYTYQDGMHQPPMGPNGGPNGLVHMRYPLPPQNMDARQMSGGRHKKEIKRRTKTGCLTCRKRRIKCDEGHPHCRNCQKSKRECLGYDPIFKTSGNPTPIQPAPGAVPPPRHDSSSAAVRGPGPAAYPAPPQGYAPAVSAGYAPPIPPQAEASFDYGAALDPALATAHAPLEPPQPTTYTTTLLPQRAVKHVPIEDLFTFDDLPPSSLPPVDDSRPLSESDAQEISAIYRQEYAPGLDRFFETPWYSMHGESLIQADKSLAIFVRHCVERFRQQKGQPEELQVLASLETELVWRLACLPRTTLPTLNFQEVQDLLRRLDTVQALLTGAILDPSKVAPFPGPPPLHLDERYMLASFWHHLGIFTSIDDSSAEPSVHTAINDTLMALRNILNVLENRDVLYSMAIARHFGGRQAEMQKDGLLVPTSNDPEDAIAKLVVAQRFIGQEESSGTTQVVQRLCGMARRGWFKQRESEEHVHHQFEQQASGQDQRHEAQESEPKMGQYQKPAHQQVDPAMQSTQYVVEQAVGGADMKEG